MDKNLPVFLRNVFDNSLDPFEDFKKIQTNFDSIFDDFFGRWDSPNLKIYKGSYPKVNLKENDNEFEIVAATPGMTKEDLNIEYKDGMLSIKGSSKQDNLEKGEKYICRELKKSSFIRSFQVDDESVNIDKIKSSYENGELRITIPKKEKVIEKKKLRQIKIE